MSLRVSAELMPIKLDENGVVRVGGTRVTLDTVITVYSMGATPEEIVEQYPVLALADVYYLIGYYLHHRAEVDEYLARQKAIATEIRQKIEARFDSTGLREKLLARKNKS